MKVVRLTFSAVTVSNFNSNLELHGLIYFFLYQFLLTDIHTNQSTYTLFLNYIDVHVT